MTLVSVLFIKTMPLACSWSAIVRCLLALEAKEQMTTQDICVNAAACASGDAKCNSRGESRTYSHAMGRRMGHGDAELFPGSPDQRFCCSRPVGPLTVSPLPAVIVAGVVAHKDPSHSKARVHFLPPFYPAY